MTKRQKEYLDYAMNIIEAENRVPTYSEIGRHFGVAKTTVFGSIGHMVDFKIARKNHDRCMLCGQLLFGRGGRKKTEQEPIIEKQPPVDTATYN